MHQEVQCNCVQTLCQIFEVNSSISKIESSLLMFFLVLEPLKVNMMWWWWEGDIMGWWLPGNDQSKLNI